MKKYSLPPKTQALIDHYLNLRVGKRVINCPYYQNVWKKRRPAVFAGKGRPEEVEVQAKKLLALKPSLNRVPLGTLKFYLVEADLGVDCSGLVVNVLAVMWP